MHAGVVGVGSSKSWRRKPPDREIVRRLLSWFLDYGRQLPWRHSSMEPWQVLVVEILLQQTNAERIAAFVPAFLADFPSLNALAATDEQTLAKRLATLGLQNRRANRLVALARALLARDGQVPNSKPALESLPGVGPYVAAAYMSTVLQEPEPMVDVNMARLIERLYGPRKLADIRYDPHINGIAHRLIRLAAPPKEFNWAVLDLGAAHCKARSPSCRNCPLLEVCPFGQLRVTSPGARSGVSSRRNSGSEGSVDFVES